MMRICSGIAKLKAHPTYGFLFPFFQRVRLEDANAFDINVAMVYPTTDAASDAYEAHYDVVFTKYLLDEAPVAGLTVGGLEFCSGYCRVYDQCVYQILLKRGARGWPDGGHIFLP